MQRNTKLNKKGIEIIPNAVVGLAIAGAVIIVFALGYLAIRGKLNFILEWFA